MSAKTETRGSKYVAGRDLADIAREVRSDIRSAVDGGTLPDCTYIVRISRFSMGQSLRITVSAVAFPLLAHSYVLTDPRQFYPGPRYSARARHLLEVLEQIVSAYRRDASDPSSDYSDCNFYRHIGFDVDAEAKHRELIAKEAGCTGCRWCAGRGCGLCAPGGVVNPPTEHEDAAELAALRAAAAPATQSPLTPPPVSYPCPAATLFPN
jgi:hypothetical protein